jgi:hypothetical protein
MDVLVATDVARNGYLGIRTVFLYFPPAPTDSAPYSPCPTGAWFVIVSSQPQHPAKTRVRMNSK